MDPCREYTDRMGCFPPLRQFSRLLRRHPAGGTRRFTLF